MSSLTLPPGVRVGLCFHGIGKQQRDLEEEEEYYWITRDRFLRILDEVATWSYVDLSFDDGNVSDVEIALPALLERGLSADFYALVGRLDDRGSLSAEHLRQLAGAGMQVGTHGWNHVPWTGLDDAAFVKETFDARDCLAEVIGRPVTKAALPLGRYDRRVLTGLRRVGYESVSTSDRALAHPGTWLLPRFSVHSPDTPESIRATVEETARLPVRAFRAAKIRLKRLR